MILLITLNFTVFVFSTVHVTIIHIESTFKKKKKKRIILLSQNANV